MPVMLKNALKFYLLLMKLAAHANAYGVWNGKFRGLS